MVVDGFISMVFCSANARLWRSWVKLARGMVARV